MDIFIDARFEPAYAAHPIVLIDAGARGGLKRNWLPARRHLRTIGFEPDAEEHRRLTARPSDATTGDLVLDVALHDRRQQLDLHLTRDRGLTSCFEPNRAFLTAFPDAGRFDILARRQVQADALDNVLRDCGVERVDFLKVDTQGSELLVLRGAAGVLQSSVVGVEVEVEFSPIYRDQPLFADVDIYLRGFGFQLFDLRPCYWKRTAGQSLGGPYGQIIWADALFLKTVPALTAIADKADPDVARAMMLKAMSVSLLYGYRDYALEIAFGAGAVFDASDRRILEDRLRAPGPPGPVPRFPGKRHLASLFRRLARALTDTDGWSVGEGKTGNLS